MQSEIGIIYKVTNLINGKIYIGQTRQKLNIRWNAHKFDARSGGGFKLANAIRKYGEDAFKIETLCEAQISELDDLEKKNV